ncbi:unnamed protein product [Toxocara canis]|uniref:Uncharacterized protein n=1 Tax=Toxocara canis TaxID=6265 RepID=A0A183UTK5_TOXCA|nr:unnamed protein product [Toxocara canis]
MLMAALEQTCCAATVVRDVEETLETMNPAQWENTAINGELLKQDTDRLLDGAETMSMSMLDYKRQLDALEGKWRKYRAQQDFNKWAALRHWLRIPGIRRRIETVEKDIRGETSRRSRRLQERIRKAEKLMEQTKNKLRDIYAIYHREGKSRFSECNLKRRIAVAIQRKNTHLQKSVRQTTAFHKFKQQTIGKAFRRGKSY